MKFDFLESRLSRLYSAYAKVVSKWPLPFLMAPILLTVALSTGCMWRLKVMPDKIDLYMPSDGPAVAEKHTLNSIFAVTESDPYYAVRRTDKNSGVIIVSAKDGSNLLNRQDFEEIGRFWTKMMHMTVRHRGGFCTYEDVCIAMPPIFNTRNHLEPNATLPCIQSLLLRAFEENPRVLQSLRQDNPLSKFLGGTRRNGNDMLTFAFATVIPYQLRRAHPEIEEISDAWEKQLVDLLISYSSDRLELNWWTRQTLARETESERKAILRMIAPLVGAVTIFTVLCCFVRSWSRSKPELGIGGVFSAGAAIVSAVGFLAYVGQEFTSVAYFMPFIIFSIGVDNVFILVSAWQKTSPALCVSDRLSLVFRDAAVSITVTSLTDGISFSIGCQISFLSVRVFCFYAAVAVVFVFFYQMTLFAAMMVYSGRREERARAFCCCIGDEDPKRESQTDYPQDHLISRFFRDVYATIIVHPITQALVVAVFVIYIGMALYGCVKVRTGLLPTDLLPQSSQAFRALRIQDEAFKHDSGRLHVTFSRLDEDLPYGHDGYWRVLAAAIEQFEDTQFTGLADFWLRNFLLYTKANKIPLTSDNFVSTLRTRFLENPAYGLYQRDVRINSINTRILASRVPIQMVNVGLENQSRAIFYLRDIARSLPLNCSVYAPFFQFADQHGILLQSMLMNVGMASLAVTLVSLLLIPKPLCSIWVCVTIVSINVGIIGYMTFWNVKLDFISMVTIVMSIGFSVDFSAHIAYHYSKDPGKSAKERIKTALYAVGTPILQSALSTLIGMSLLTRLDSYIYQSFVKTIILVVSLGVFHGLIILPVLLTIFHLHKGEEEGGGGSGSGPLDRTSTPKAKPLTEVAHLRPPAYPGSYRVSNGYSSRFLPSGYEGQRNNVYSEPTFPAPGIHNSFPGHSNQAATSAPMSYAGANRYLSLL